MIKLERRILLLTTASLLLFNVVGCGGPVGPTSGVVRFDDGTPVQAGSIELRRTTDQQRFSSRISPNGTFEPVSQDGDLGLPPGQYDVVVVQDLAIEDHTHGKTVPRRYADYYTSGLKVEVTEGQTTPVEVVIESESEDG